MYQKHEIALEIKDLIDVKYDFEINLYDINKYFKLDIPDRDQIRSLDIFHYRLGDTFLEEDPKKNDLDALDESSIPHYGEQAQGDIKSYFPLNDKDTVFNFHTGYDDIEESVGHYRITHFKGNLVQYQYDHSPYEKKIGAVWEISEDEAKIVLIRDHIEQEDLTNLPKEMNYVHLKAPLKVGNKWENSNGEKSYIASVDKIVTTPSGTYNAIEVICQDGDNIIKTYYAKGMGIVKTVYDIYGHKSYYELTSVEKQ